MNNNYNSLLNTPLLMPPSSYCPTQNGEQYNMNNDMYMQQSYSNMNSSNNNNDMAMCDTDNTNTNNNTSIASSSSTFYNPFNTPAKPSYRTNANPAVDQRSYPSPNASSGPSSSRISLSPVKSLVISWQRCPQCTLSIVPTSLDWSSLGTTISLLLTAYQRGQICKHNNEWIYQLQQYNKLHNNIIMSTHMNNIASGGNISQLPLSNNASSHGGMLMLTDMTHHHNTTTTTTSNNHSMDEMDVIYPSSSTIRQSTNNNNSIIPTLAYPGHLIPGELTEIPSAAQPKRRLSATNNNMNNIQSIDDDPSCWDDIMIPKRSRQYHDINTQYQNGDMWFKLGSNEPISDPNMIPSSSSSVLSPSAHTSHSIIPNQQSVQSTKLPDRRHALVAQASGNTSHMSTSPSYIQSQIPTQQQQKNASVTALSSSIPAPLPQQLSSSPSSSAVIALGGGRLPSSQAMCAISNTMNANPSAQQYMYYPGTCLIMPHQRQQQQQPSSHVWNNNR